MYDTIHLKINMLDNNIRQTQVHNYLYIKDNRLSPRVRWQHGYSRHCYRSGNTSLSISPTEVPSLQIERKKIGRGYGTSLWVEQRYKGGIIVCLLNNYMVKIIFKPIYWPTLDDAFLHLEYILGDYINLTSAEITRLDLTLDIEGQTFCDIYRGLNVKEKQNQSLHMNRGISNSSYYGAQMGNNTFLLYDKREKILKSRNAEEINGYIARGFNPDIPLVRLEKRLTKKDTIQQYLGLSSLSVPQLRHLRLGLLRTSNRALNPFKDVGFYEITPKNPYNFNAAYRQNLGYALGELNAIGWKAYKTKHGRHSNDYFTTVLSNEGFNDIYQERLQAFSRIPHPDREVRQDVIGPPCLAFMSGLRPLLEAPHYLQRSIQPNNDGLPEEQTQLAIDIEIDNDPDASSCANSNL